MKIEFLEEQGKVIVNGVEYERVCGKMRVFEINGIEITDDIKRNALDLYKPPFIYKAELGWIFDGDGKQVLDEIDETAVLRISGFDQIGYHDNPKRLQDAVGHVVAQALTEFWMREGKK